jgi:hypothetical protein
VQGAAQRDRGGVFADQGVGPVVGFEEVGVVGPAAQQELELLLDARHERVHQEAALDVGAEAGAGLGIVDRAEGHGAPDQTVPLAVDYQVGARVHLADVGETRRLVAERTTAGLDSRIRFR